MSAARGRASQPNVLAMATVQCHLSAGIGAAQISITEAMYRSASFL